MGGNKALTPHFSFSVSIGENYFTLNSIKLAIKSDDISISGQCSFENCFPWPVKLFSPYNRSMQSKIYESLDAHVHCIFKENDHTVLDDIGSHAGFEIVGDIDNLIAH
ncbi:MAG: hypothetical protein AB1444_11070 [Spirochaetota bacterium]